MEHRGVTIGMNPGCPAVTTKWCYQANYIVGPLLLPNGLGGQGGDIINNKEKPKNTKAVWSIDTTQVDPTLAYMLTVQR